MVGFGSPSTIVLLHWDESTNGTAEENPSSGTIGRQPQYSTIETLDSMVLASLFIVCRFCCWILWSLMSMSTMISIVYAYHHKHYGTFRAVILDMCTSFGLAMLCAALRATSHTASMEFDQIINQHSNNLT
jgi:hypothetical protein